MDDYKLNYAFQTFNLSGNIACAHSFFNESGCFTINSMESRGELDCYYSQYFSNDRDKLYGEIIDIYSVEMDIWNKHGNFGVLPNMFFWVNNKKILKVLAEVVKAQIKKNNEFFGVKVTELDNNSIGYKKTKK